MLTDVQGNRFLSCSYSHHHPRVRQCYVLVLLIFETSRKWNRTAHILLLLASFTQQCTFLNESALHGMQPLRFCAMFHCLGNSRGICLLHQRWFLALFPALGSNISVVIISALIDGLLRRIFLKFQTEVYFFLLFIPTLIA